VTALPLGSLKRERAIKSVGNVRVESGEAGWDTVLLFLLVVLEEVREYGLLLMGSACDCAGAVMGVTRRAGMARR
jgi:hypothetical protein